MTLASQFDNKEKSSNELEKKKNEVLEKVILNADLSSLSPSELVRYLYAVCNKFGIDPVTQPFQFIKLNGKLTLYATKACAAALIELKSISTRIVSQEQFQDVFVVTCEATRKDENGETQVAQDIGVVPIANLKGDQLGNAMMKAATKAKRRTVLNMAGLGTTDETELQSIANVSPQPVVKVEVDEQGEIAAEEVIEPEPSPVAQRVINDTRVVNSDEEDWRLQTCEEHRIDWELVPSQFENDTHYRKHEDPKCYFMTWIKNKVLVHLDLPSIEEGGDWYHDKVKIFHSFTRQKNGTTLSEITQAAALATVDEFLLQNKGALNG